MDDFERIKTLTAKCIQSNFINTSTIKRWKLEIRQCLMRIRSKFIDQIDGFIFQFGNVFKNVELSTELLEFKGEDNKMLTQVKDLQKKYMEINKVFMTLQSSTAQQKIDYIDKIQSYMQNIEKKVNE